MSFTTQETLHVIEDRSRCDSTFRPGPVLQDSSSTFSNQVIKFILDIHLCPTNDIDSIPIGNRRCELSTALGMEELQRDAEAGTCLPSRWSGARTAAGLCMRGEKEEHDRPSKPIALGTKVSLEVWNARPKFVGLATPVIR
ncbi:hypothetical protein C8R44DRAFT_741617 [Mycena epipterygia]|nr:hypothetical protein C8R44DRAFT_741617 [Mycena epipterygia]